MSGEWFLLLLPPGKKRQNSFLKQAVCLLLSPLNFRWLDDERRPDSQMICSISLYKCEVNRQGLCIICCQIQETPCPYAQQTLHNQTWSGNKEKERQCKENTTNKQNFLQGLCIFSLFSSGKNPQAVVAVLSALPMLNSKEHRLGQSWNIPISLLCQIEFIWLTVVCLLQDQCCSAQFTRWQPL